ncbi:MAG: hypothetical protein AAF490_01700 [Chloroflexota bacterium]
MNHRNHIKPRYELFEYEPCLLPRVDLPEKVGHDLWQKFDEQSKVLQVRFPSPITEQKWSLTSQGWVGVLATKDIELLLSPRFSIKNIFGLWAYVYGFEKSPLKDGWTQLETVADFPHLLAGWLAKSVIRCAKTGFAKSYINQTETLPYVRGRVLQFQPTKTAVFCQYDQLTTNIPDNQILAYTLNLLCRSPLLDMKVQQQVRQATHLINQVAEAVPFTTEEINGRIYHPHTEKYRLMHQLCRFFLEQIGPAHAFGEAPFSTFLIHTPTLFERFVAKWLKQNLPPQWRINIQERISLDTDNPLVFQIDIVLYNKQEGTPLAVVDTKYKTGAKISSSDIHQIIAYAKVKSSPNAILIFPTDEKVSLNVHVDDIHLQALHFDLNQSFEQAGQQIISQIFNL